MKSLQFWKTQTIGNDFVLIRNEDVEGENLAEVARELCSRHFGIGSDGLLTVAPTPWGLELRMFNPDGTEDFCGNGLRCAGWHGFLEGWVDGLFEILHGGQRVPAEVYPDGRVAVTLAPVDFRPESVPLQSGEECVDRILHGLTGSAVSAGSPHFVVLTDELPSDESFFSQSPLVETDSLFPEHISVMYTKQIGPAQLKLRIWERSAGETLGCGTGSSAAAAVWARKTGYAGEVVVSNPGGDLIVRLDSWHSPVTSISSPKRVFTGVVPLLAEVRSNGRATLA